MNKPEVKTVKEGVVLDADGSEVYRSEESRWQERSDRFSRVYSQVKVYKGSWPLIIGMIIVIPALVFAGFAIAAFVLAGILLAALSRRLSAFLMRR